MDMGTYLRFALALVFVLALIAGLAWAVRRFGLAGAVGVKRPGKHRRLSLVETLAVDAKRRLVLIRRDGVEHLMLVGGEHDLLVEAGIPAEDAAAPDRGGNGGGPGSRRRLAPAPAAAPADAPAADASDTKAPLTKAPLTKAPLTKAPLTKALATDAGSPGMAAPRPPADQEGRRRDGPLARLRAAAAPDGPRLGDVLGESRGVADQAAGGRGALAAPQPEGRTS